MKKAVKLILVLSLLFNNLIAQDLSKKEAKADILELKENLENFHEFDYVVSAVVTDPSNTHLQFQCLVAWETTVPGRGYYPYNFM